MATPKKADKTAEKNVKWYVRFAKWTSPKAIKVADRVAQVFAALFVLATSFLYVRDWLLSNQVNYDFSLVGAILVMSIALYLIVRKR